MKRENKGKQQYNIKLLLMYEGSKFSGWQRLGNGKELTTIQGILEHLLSSLFEEDVKVIGSGRTDAGVHAYEQVANFHVSKKIDLLKLQRRMNEELPKEIQIIGAEYVSNQFHSRYDAVSKYYEYHIATGDVESVFYRNQRLYVKGQLDVASMREGAKLLCGTHDFAGFSSAMPDGRSTIKTLYEVEIIEQENGFVIRYHGDGFLYNMVRIMTGTLLEIGLGKRKVNTILEVFDNKKRQNAGITVPGIGLFLKKVVYL